MTNQLSNELSLSRSVIIKMTFSKQCTLQSATAKFALVSTGIRSWFPRCSCSLAKTGFLSCGVVTKEQNLFKITLSSLLFRGFYLSIPYFLSSANRIAWSETIAVTMALCLLINRSFYFIVSDKLLSLVFKSCIDLNWLA